MKRQIKKVVTTVLAVALAVGMAQTPQSAKAAASYHSFKNKWSQEDCGIGFITEKKETYQISTEGNKPKITGYIVYPNDNLYFVAPHGADGKVLWAKSSNNKVAAVVDQQKGHIKLKNASGSSMISFKVQYKYNKDNWSYHKDLALKNPGRVIKVTKKGNTCTMEFKARIYLMCKNGKHKYGAWKVTYKPTCSETGTKKRVCKKCHFEKEAKIKATGKHVYGEWEEEKATCEDEGYKYRTCKTCDKEQEVKIPALGHKYNETTGECEICGQHKDN